jgi:hypothetical protein
MRCHYRSYLSADLRDLFHAARNQAREAEMNATPPNPSCKKAV